jgi:plastocyanin
MKTPAVVAASAFLALLAAPSLPVAPASAATHDIDQVGLTFTPDSLDVEVGDTVVWHWSAGTHTVTNGEGAADPNVGTLFDAPLSSAAPTFSFTFTTAGRVPYFCRPHETLGMKGVVIVQDSPVAAEEPRVVDTDWSRIKTLYR